MSRPHLTAAARRRLGLARASHLVCGRARGGRLVGRIRRSQHGFSLIEVLIAAALASTVILGIAAGMLTLMSADATTADNQRVQLALGNFGESIKALEYVPCVTGPTNAATPSLYTAKYNGFPGAYKQLLVRPIPWAPAADTPVVAQLIDVKYWNSTTKSFGACASPDGGAQMLTVRVWYHDTTATAQIVKGTR